MATYTFRKRKNPFRRITRWGLWLVLAGALVGGLIFTGVQGGIQWRAMLVRKGCDRPFPDLVKIQPLLMDQQRVRFAVLGDSGMGDAGQAQVATALGRVCAAAGCDFALLLGDNIYPSGVSSLDDPKLQTHVEQVYGPLAIPLHPVLGNHDIRKNGLVQVLHTLRSKTWRMPNYQYAFTTPQAAFFALNTNCSLFAWQQLERDMVGVSAPWRIVFGHHPLYGSGNHGSADPITLRLWMQDLAPQVDFYLSGHNHILEHLAREGERTQYISSGAAGWSGATAGSPHARSEVDATSLFRHDEGGFGWFDLTAVRATFRFYDSQGKMIYQYHRDR